MATTIQQRLGERIAKLRDRRGMTAVELSEDVGVSKNYISAVEHGKVNLTLNQIVRIANSLQCNLATLVKGVDQ